MWRRWFRTSGGETPERGPLPEDAMETSLALLFSMLTWAALLAALAWLALREGDSDGGER